MMNIRGLAFDDPYGSQVIKLTTIEFRVPSGASTGGENGDVDI